MAKPLLLALLVLLGAGCESLGRRTGMAYQLDWDKIGTGEQAVVPVHDATHINGQPIDLRRR